MNWAHVHLVLNHVPVLGTIFGLALFGYALIRRSDSLKRAALNTFVAVALLAIPAYLTGEPAEDVVERTAGVARDQIDPHEDAALAALAGVELVGLVALVGLYAARRGRAVSPKTTAAVLVLGLAAAALMARTAYLGGRIHHEEIRTDAPPATPAGEADDDR